MRLLVKKLRDTAITPSYANRDDAGLDLYSTDQVMIDPGERVLVHTGISVQLPAGFEAQIRPRSGLALKNGITVLNSPGTIDAGYRGEVCVVLINFGQVAFGIEVGMRVAQMIIGKVYSADVCVVPSLDESARGADGFGSTGL
jgi:dUTP pyrophosphatase